jgi:hypothetical protein
MTRPGGCAIIVVLLGLWAFQPARAEQAANTGPAITLSQAPLCVVVSRPGFWEKRVPVKSLREAEQMKNKIRAGGLNAGETVYLDGLKPQRMLEFTDGSGGRLKKITIEDERSGPAGPRLLMTEVRRTAAVSKNRRAAVVVENRTVYDTAAPHVTGSYSGTIKAYDVRGTILFERSTPPDMLIGPYAISDTAQVVAFMQGYPSPEARPAGPAGEVIIADVSGRELQRVPAKESGHLADWRIILSPQGRYLCAAGNKESDASFCVDVARGKVWQAGSRDHAPYRIEDNGTAYLSYREKHSSTVVQDAIDLNLCLEAAAADDTATPQPAASLPH